MVGEDQCVYAVDSHEAGSGAYFDGSWDDEDEWELAKGPSSLMPSCEHRDCQKLDVNRTSLSDTIETGSPHDRT